MKCVRTNVVCALADVVDTKLSIIFLFISYFFFFLPLIFLFTLRTRSACAMGKWAPPSAHSYISRSSSPKDPSESLRIPQNVCGDEHPQCVKWTPTCVWDEHQPVFRDEHQPVCKDEHPSVCVDEHSAVGYDRQNYWLTDKQFYIKGELKICSLPFSYFLMCSSNSVFGPQLPCLRGEKWMVKYSGDSNQAKIFQMYFMRLFLKGR